MQELVLLPGFGFHSSVFQRLITQLSNQINVRVTLIDLLNLPPMADHVIAEHVMADHVLTECVLPYVLEQAPKKALWLGWSLGGLITLLLARLYPERMQGFITVGTTPKFLEDESWPGVSQNTFQKFQENIDKNPQETLNAFLFLQGNSLKDRSTIQFLKDHICKEYTLRSLRTLKMGLEILQTTNLREQLSTIKCPGLCLFSEKDQLVPATTAINMQKLVSHTNISVIPNQGHGSFLAEPKAVLDEITNFCRREFFVKEKFL